jgi:hypothetical protein
MNSIQELMAYLLNRRRAYKRLFDKDSEDVKIILADLAKFCRANQSTFHTNERTHAVLEGRREVWLRLQQHLNLSEEDLWALYSRKG